MKLQKFTTEDTEKKSFAFSPKEYPLKEITERIISCAMEVHSTLGPGLLESIYEEALAQELTIRGITYEKTERDCTEI